MLAGLVVSVQPSSARQAGLEVPSRVADDPPPAVEPVGEKAPERTQEDYDRDMRSLFGLATDDPTIAGLGDKRRVVTWHGVRMTPAERDGVVRQIERVDRWKAALPDVRAKLGDRYGGSWVDHPAGGALHLNVVGANADDRSVVSVAGVDVELHDVPVSEAELQAIADGLNDRDRRDREAIDADRDRPVVSISVDIKQSKVVVRGQLSPGERSELAGSVDRSDLVVFDSSSAEVIPMGPRDDGAPYRPGDALFSKSEHGGLCTGAYTVIKEGAPHVLTAGHCAPIEYNGGSGTIFYNATNSADTGVPGRTMGEVSVARFHDGLPGDAALVKLNTDWQTPQPDTCVYINTPESGVSCRQIVEFASPDIVTTGLRGELLCFSGVTSEYQKCLTSWAYGNYSYSTPGGSRTIMNLVDAIRVDMGPLGGDSGGPVYALDGNGQSVRARGVVSGTFQDGSGHFSDLLFTPWHVVEQAVGPFTTPPVPRYVDVTTGHLFYSDIEWASSRGIVNGDAAGNFDPLGDVSNVALVAMLYRSAGWPAGSFLPTFAADQPSAFVQEFKWAVDTKLYDTVAASPSTCTAIPPYLYRCVRPSLTATRKDVARIFYRFAGSPYDHLAVGSVPNPGFTDVSTSHPDYRAIAFLKARQVASGCTATTFCPDVAVNRQVFTRLLKNLNTARRFDDVQVPHGFFREIEWAHAMGLVNGSACGSAMCFNPSSSMSRQAIAQVLYQASGSPTFTLPATPHFADVPSGHQFYLPIEWAYTQGIVQGYTSGCANNAPLCFKPQELVSRQAMAVFVYRMYGSPNGPFPDPNFADVPGSHLFADEIWWARQNRLVTGYADGTFRPADPVSRQSAISVLFRADLRNVIQIPPGP